jgi:hypothetical protein
VASLVGVATGLALHHPRSASLTEPTEPRALVAALADAGAAARTPPPRDAAPAATVADAGAAPPDDVARAPDAPRPPVRAIAPVIVRPVRPPAALHNPEAEAHLRAAEDAFRDNLPPLRQLAEADAALRADPRSVRAKFLLADALLRSGDLDRGCKYLAEIKRVAAARARGRAAGCPGD